MKKPFSDAVRRSFGGALSGSLPRRIAFVLLLAYVLAAPFPWGAVQPGWTGTGKISLGAFAIGLLACLSPDVRLRIGRAWIPVAAVSAIGALGLVQLLPLPRSVLGLLSPMGLETWSDAGKILALHGQPAPVPRLTLAVAETWSVAILAFAFAVLFLAAAALLDTRARRRVFATALVLAGLLQILAALANEDRITRLRGAFVNPNHFSGYLEIGLAVAFGIVWYRSRWEFHELLEADTPEKKITRLEKMIPRLVATVLLWATFAVAIGLSQSRGGILAALGGTLLLLSFAAQHRREGGARRPAFSFGLTVSIVLGFAFALTSAREAALLRFFLPDKTDLAEDYRVLILQPSIEAFKLFPWTGSGLGAFREAFRVVQPASIRGLVDQAHNEYLQILVTAGLPGALLATTALVAGTWLLIRGFFRQPHREESAFALGGLGALLTLLLHGLAEFNFSVPAIPATMATLLGGAWAAIQWRRSDEPVRAEPVRATRRLHRRAEPQLGSPAA